MLTDLGASVVVLHEGHILLILREDTEVWGLPGGQVEPDESVAEAARREVREETGVIVHIDRLVGIYSVPGWLGTGGHNVVFVGHPTGGEPRPQAEEILQLAYFHPDHLPDPLIWWHEQRIRDALAGVGGSAAWTQHVPWPAAIATPGSSALYAARDASSLPRRDFFLQHFSRPTTDLRALQVREVGPE